MSDHALPLEISPQEVKTLMDRGESLRLIDVREPDEHRITRIEGAELVPVGSVAAAFSKLEAAADNSRLIVYCHHGMRSLNVTAWLRGQGLEACQSMAGGIDRWSREIDPSVSRY